MSWSSHRTKENQRNATEIIEKIEVVNAVLRQLAVDSDLTDDLTDPVVQIAIKHWTNEKRLNGQEIKILEDNYRVLAVLKKLVCFFLHMFSNFFSLLLITSSINYNIHVKH